MGSSLARLPHKVSRSDFLRDTGIAIGFLLADLVASPLASEWAQGGWFLHVKGFNIFSDKIFSCFALCMNSFNLAIITVLKYR